MALGYRRFESVGEDMDPSRHEALGNDAEFRRVSWQGRAGYRSWL